MSDIIRIDQLEDAEPLASGDLKVIFQPSSGGTRREKKQDALIQNPRSFTSGRFDSQELISGALSVQGWYTIAETDANNSEPMSALFTVAGDGATRNGVLIFRINAAGSTNAKTYSNVTVEILGRSSENVNFSVMGALRARLAKSDSVGTAGFKVQVYLDISTSIIIVSNILQNVAHRGIQTAGFFLVTPYLDNTPTLPDGLTASTFLEAGEELSFPDDTIDVIKLRKVSNDALLATVYMPEIPKQGTGISITFPSTNLIITDGTGVSINLTTATYSNFVITGNILNFRINNVAAFTSLNTGPLVSEANGTGGKVTIT